MRQIKMMPIGEVYPYPDNPRKNDEAVDAVATSLKEYGWQQPIVVDKDNVIIVGHTRRAAAAKLGWKEVPVLVADNLTDEQVKAYRLADNRTAEFADWDNDLLKKELEELKDLDYDITLTGFDESFLNSLEPPMFADSEGHQGALADKFLVPPFSVLDTRQGAWQERKRAWKALGLASGDGRNEGLIGGGGLKELANNMANNSLTGTSIFDPVLCELMYIWFCMPKGKILDPFAGGSVRGIVAEYLGYDYTGVDLSRKQIEANYEQAEEMGVSPKWYVDDSRNIDNYAEDGSIDLVLSCPPYFDLEKYSDDPNDLSNMSYEDFLTNYGIIISKCMKKLKDDRFAVWVICDVRDKKTGCYRDLVSETIRIFREAGGELYNHIILVNCIATAALRAKRQFQGLRKVVTTHQDVLVFYKGDPKKIKENYPEVEVADISEDAGPFDDIGPFDA